MNLLEGILNKSRQVKYIPPPSKKPLSEKDIFSALNITIWNKKGGPSVFDIALPGEKICIVVSDHTRRTNINQVLPFLIRGLKEKGCASSDIFFLIASGIHRRPTQIEIEKILGKDIAAAFSQQIIFHDPDNPSKLVSVGKTRRNHEVKLNKFFVEADKKIVTGTVSFHYHAGFGGGRKAIVPGIAARETIAFNHSLTLDPIEDKISPTVEPGKLDGNLVAEEMFEAASLCKPDIIINTVLSPAGDLIGLFCGDMDIAHRQACKMVEKYCVAKLKQKADLVIASAGTALNWIQSHKALYNAHRAVNPDGYVILEAPCPEGLGDELFRKWIKLADVHAICRQLRANPEILGQTALSTYLKGKNTILITKLSEADILDLGIQTASDMPSAIKMALNKLAVNGKTDPTWCILEQALHILPVVEE